MHKVRVERLREEVIPKTVGNQETSQRDGGLNREDQTTVGTVVKQSIKRKIVGIERKMKEINQT